MAMKESISRRDFLKLGGIASVSTVMLPFNLSKLNLKTPESKNKFMPTFEYLGPPIIRETKVADGGSEGERTFWVDSDDANKMLVGTWESGLWKTVDGGKYWESVNIPVIQRKNREPSVARDMMTIPGTKNILAVFDYSLAVGTLNSKSWKEVKLPTDHWQTQTACILPNGKLIVGGRGFPNAGVAITDIKSPSFLTDPYWKTIDGGYIRTITHTLSSNQRIPGKIFYGGWKELENDGTQAGTGLICIDGKDFKVIPEYSHTFEDDRGPMSVNTIKTTNYDGHEIIFVGGEGTGWKNGRKFDVTRPSLQILVDNKILSQEQVNPKGLFESGGGSDLITPQRGIVVCEETGEVLISTGFKEISRAPLDDIVSGRKIKWERITKAPKGQTDFGALHMALTKRNEIPALVVGRKIYGNGYLPFQQVGMADLASEVGFKY